MKSTNDATSLALSSEDDLEAAAFYFPHAIAGNRSLFDSCEKEEEDRIINALLPHAINPNSLNILRAETSIIASESPGKSYLKILLTGTYLVSNKWGFSPPRYLDLFLPGCLLPNWNPPSCFPGLFSWI